MKLEAPGVDDQRDAPEAQIDQRQTHEQHDGDEHRTVILLIFDLDRPSSGFITNNQQSMIDTAASTAAFSD
jgi:hypothetical protein